MESNTNSNHIQNYRTLFAEVENHNEKILPASRHSQLYMQVCFCYEDARYLVGGGEACKYVFAMKM